MLVQTIRASLFKPTPVVIVDATVMLGLKRDKSNKGAGP